MLLNDLTEGFWSNMRFEWRQAGDLSAVEVEAWRRLGRAACSGNIYLTPDFLMPVLQHLHRGAGARLAILWQGGAMAALGVFVAERPSLRFPFRRLTALRSRHSFQSGVLLRPGLPDAALDAYLDGLMSDGASAIRFAELRADSRAYRALRAALRRRGMRWFADDEYLRAAVVLTRPEAWRGHVSRSRHKRMAAQWRRLGARGTVEFRIVGPDETTRETIDEFLRLESAGWKAGTGLLADPADEAFFREVCRRAPRQVFFCELLLNGRRIASSANFYVGARGFAFKIGCDPQYARYSPGLLLEYQALQHLDLWPASLLEVESGAQAGSYVDEYWPERIPMVSGHAVGGSGAMLFARVKYALKRRRVRTVHADLRPEPILDEPVPVANDAATPAPARSAKIIYLSDMRP